MASDCAVHVQAETIAASITIALAAEAEVRRIEARYSRYRGDSELARINLVAAVGGATDLRNDDLRQSFDAIEKSLHAPDRLDHASRAVFGRKAIAHQFQIGAR